MQITFVYSLYNVPYSEMSQLVAIIGDTALVDVFTIIIYVPGQTHQSALQRILITYILPSIAKR